MPAVQKHLSPISDYYLIRTVSSAIFELTYLKSSLERSRVQMFEPSRAKSFDNAPGKPYRL